MKKGQFFGAKDTKNHKHPIVHIEKMDDEKFSACILSSKGTNGNLPMNENHLEISNESGENYKSSIPANSSDH